MKAKTKAAVIRKLAEGNGLTWEAAWDDSRGQITFVVGFVDEADKPGIPALIASLDLVDARGVISVLEHAIGDSER